LFCFLFPQILSLSAPQFFPQFPFSVYYLDSFSVFSCLLIVCFYMIIQSVSPLSFLLSQYLSEHFMDPCIPRLLDPIRHMAVVARLCPA
jgi:hypothetical protein